MDGAVCPVSHQRLRGGGKVTVTPLTTVTRMAMPGPGHRTGAALAYACDVNDPRGCWFRFAQVTDGGAGDGTWIGRAVGSPQPNPPGGGPGGDPAGRIPPPRQPPVPPLPPL